MLGFFPQWFMIMTIIWEAKLFFAAIYETQSTETLWKNVVKIGV